MKTKARDSCPACGQPAALFPLGTRYDLTLATHDMRALLTIALGHVELLETAVVGEGEPVCEASRLLRRVEATSRALWRLVALVDEIRDMARLQVGHAVDLRLEEVDLGALIQAVVAEYHMEAGRARVHTTGETVRVRGDRARLERVLHNLLDNAVKYSPVGTPVDVDVQIQEQRGMITVRDQGRGIPVEELPRIFTRFYRASTAHDVAGSGLGLAGAKAIIEDHHGQITVQSAVGQGTTVTVMLPCLMADLKPPVVPRAVLRCTRRGQRHEPA